MTERDIEAPTADALAQQQSVTGDDEESGPGEERELPFDVNEADAAEQQRAVDLDEDDYR